VAEVYRPVFELMTWCAVGVEAILKWGASLEISIDQTAIEPVRKRSRILSAPVCPCTRCSSTSSSRSMSAILICVGIWVGCNPPVYLCSPRPHAAAGIGSAGFVTGATLARGGGTWRVQEVGSSEECFFRRAAQNPLLIFRGNKL
jgi:hypothetical protein